MSLPTVLTRIIDRKHEEVAERIANTSINELKAIIAEQDAPRGFVKALRDKNAQGLPAIIAEIKKASPSKGVIRENFDPVSIAQSYEQAGAACLSILTDRDYFQGHEDYLKAARAATKLPVIRKDFTVDVYQVYEARAIGADCILLIVAAFMNNPLLLKELYALAKELEMDVLVEVHTAEELQLALELGLDIVGINNRDLHTFDVSLDNTFNLLADISDDILVVTESGIATRDDIQQMQAKQVNAFLIGEAFMRETDPGQGLKDLFLL